ncbi:leukotriene B4 receptor 1-like [Arapaima gigas]
MQLLNNSALNFTTRNMTSNVAPCVLLAICTLVGVPGNLLVVIVILRNVHRATLTTKLMLNLAVTDTLSLLLLPLWIPPLLGPWPYSLAACKLLSYVVYCTMYASVLTITLMSVQRYMLVLHPHCRLRRLPKCSRVKTLLGVLWALALALASPVVPLRELLDMEGQLRCQPHYSSDGQKVAVLLLETLLGFVVPGIILATSYLCIAHRVSQLPFTSGKRLSRLITWVVASFFFFWFPSHVVNMLQVCRFQAAAEQIRNVAGGLTFFNSCLNPFLYTFATRSRWRQERACASKPTDIPPPDSQAANLTNPVFQCERV